MKKIIVILGMFCLGFVFAQDPVEKKVIYKKSGNLVEATFYDTNGNIEQHGFFKNDKREGNWISYTKNGEKKAIGYYENGKMNGKWIFKNGDTLSEVDYLDNKIVNVAQWSNKTKMAIRDK